MKKLISFISIIIIILIVFFLTRFSLFYVSDVNGFYFNNDELFDSITNPDTVVNSYIETEKVKLYQNLYLRNDNVYIGEKIKSQVNIDYPIFSKDGSQVVNLSSESVLINDNFQNEKAYKGIILTGGIAYNQGDSNPKSKHSYYFLKLENGLMVNLCDIDYDYGVKKGVIPANSIAVFTEDYIHFYINKDGKFVFNSIKLITEDTTIKINKNEMSYYTFLESLNLLNVVIPDLDYSGEYSDGFTGEVEIPDNIVDPYIPPVVKFDKFTSKVYTASGKMTLIDEGGVIKRSPTFTFYLDDQIFLSRQVTLNGDFTLQGLEPDKTYKVIGDFTYYTEDGKLVEATFYEGSVTTLGLDTLTPVNLSYDINEHFSNKVVFNNIKFDGDLKSEVLFGINKAIISINDNQYPISKNDINKMLLGKEISINTPNSLQSDSTYDYEILFYDKFNNLLPFTGNTGTTFTIKMVPEISISKNKDFTSIEVDFELNNKDNVSIGNFYYEIYDLNKNLIMSNNFDVNKTLHINNLDTDAIYYIYVYADYDLEDGKGIQQKQLLRYDNVETINLDDLGPLRVLYSYQKGDIKSDSANLGVGINYTSNENTDLIMSFLDRLEVVISDNDNNYQETYIIDGDNIQEAIHKFNIENLVSATNYNIKTSAILKLGDREYPFKVMHNLDSFKTIKADPVFKLENLFESNNFISFDVQVIDIDEAIDDNRIVMAVYDNKDRLIDYQFVDTNKGLKNFNFDNLDENIMYKVLFYAESCDLKDGNGAQRLIFKSVDSEGNESDYYYFTTTDKLKGNIELNSLLKKIKSVNQFNIADKDKWLSSGSGVDLREYDLNKNILTLGLKANGTRAYSYYVPELKNKKVKVYFNIKARNNSTISNTFQFSFLNGKSGATKINLNTLNENENIVSIGNVLRKSASSGQGYVISGVNDYYIQSNEFTVNSNGYITFQLTDTDASAGNFIEIHNFAIVEESNYEYFNFPNPYQEDLDYLIANFSYTFEDTREVIEGVTSKEVTDLYLNICNNKNECERVSRENIDDEQTNPTNFEEGNIIKDLLKNQEFTISLNIDVNFGEDVLKSYTLDQISFSTEEEIRAINNANDFKTVHNKGKYIVNNDLDFTSAAVYLQNLNTGTFYGTIDFQGHSIDITTRNAGQSYKSPIYSLGRGSRVMNVELNVHLNHTSLLSSYSPFVTSNYGTITNVKVNLIKDVENIGVLQYYSFIVYNNYGIIENFAVDVSEDIKFNFYSGVVVRYNEGIIRNGYVVGDGKVDTRYTSEYVDNKYIGLVSGYTTASSLITNVYTAVDLDMFDSSIENFVNHWQVGNIVGVNNMGIINNSFSTGKGANRTNHEYFTDINVGRNSNRLGYDNLYYISNDNLTNSYSTNVSLSYLSNVDFIDNLLNYQFGMFEVKKNLEESHYPTLKWPSYMPNQSLYKFTKGVDDSKVDFISAEEVPESELPEDFYGYKQNKYNTKKLKLKIYNSSLQKISDVGIKGVYVSVYMDEQEDTKLGYSYVYVKVSTYNELGNQIATAEYNDTYYLTYISILDSVVKKEYYDYQQDTAKDRRTAVFSLYKEVSTTSDWVAMNNKNYNFILTNDLDFSSCNSTSCYYIADFKGKLNGNNKTISNITTRNNSVGAIRYLYGSISNLNIENYTQPYTSSYSGFIYQTQNGSLIDNVHIKNVKLTSGSYMGGLVGYLYYGTLTNSSISDFRIDKSSYTFESSIVGGLVGYSYYSKISNCASYDFYYDMTGNLNSGEVGGLVGYIYGGLLSNSIVNGEIHTSSKRAGGLASKSSAAIYNNITYVDIYSERDYTGGIVGDVLGNTLVSIYSNLTFGNVFSTNTGSYIGRTVGYYRTTSERSINYAYEKQKINGFVSYYSETETLFDDNELIDSITYKEVMGFDDNFNYDKISEGYLPRLTYSYDNTKVINEDKLINFKKDYDIIPIEIDSETQSNNVINVTVKFDMDYFLNEDGSYNVDKLIRKFKIEGESRPVDIKNQGDDDLTNDEPNLCNFYEENNIYSCTFNLQPTNYFDNYNITHAVLDNGEEVRLNLRVDESLYKIINFKDDWLTFFGTNNTNKNMQNIIVTNDIDFGGSILNSITSINRLISGKKDESGNIVPVTFKNFKVAKSFIEVMMSELNNIKFDNILVTGKSNYSGVIARNFADLNNISFNNITVVGGHHTGCIGSDNSNNINLIKVTNALIYGTYNVGGFTGYEGKADITNISIDNVSVFAGGNTSSTTSNTGYYVGGMFGYLATASGVTYSNFQISNSNVVGAHNVGGMIGYHESSINNAKVTNVNVIGRRYLSNAGTTTNMYSYRVGGVTGTSASGLNNATATNVNVINNGREVGGITGYSGSTAQYNYLLNSNVINYQHAYYVKEKLPSISTIKFVDTSKITNPTGEKFIPFNEGTTQKNLEDMTLSNFLVDNNYNGAFDQYRSNLYIGGIMGFGYSSIQYCGIKNSNIYTERGTYTGGLVSQSTSTYSDVYNYITNTKIEGNDYVGGLIGKTTANLNYYNQINVDVKGNDYVGGIIGYVDNSKATASLYYTRSSHSVLERTKVTGGNANTGAIYGVSKLPMTLSNKLYNLVVDVDLEKTNSNYNSYIIGNYLTGDQNNTSNIFVYDKAKYKYGDDIKNIGDTEQTGYDYSRLITLSDLKIDGTNYYNTIGLNSNFKRTRTDLQGLYYPYLSAGVKLVADKVELPVEEPTATSLSLRNNLSKISEDHILPTFDIYTVDANIINIDFSNIDSESYFSIQSGDEIIDYTSINERTYSLEYNFKEDIIVSITDGNKYYSKTIKKEDLIKDYSIIGDKYYYLDSGRIITNSDKIEGEYVSLFKEHALSKNGDLYRLTDGVNESSSSLNIRLLDTSVPLYEFIYNEFKIKTYNTYSISNDEVIDNKILYVNNNNLSVFSDMLEFRKDSIILDYYNDSEYKYVLGNDGVLYSLSDSFKLPDSVKDSGIKNMSNNLFNNTDILYLEYKDGSRVCFNYKTGNIIFKTDRTEIVNIVDYLVTGLSLKSSINTREIINSEEDSNNLITKLTKSIEEMNLTESDSKEVSKLNINKDTKYVSVYEPLTGKTEVYDESKLLGKTNYQYKEDSSVTNDSSINNVIIKNNTLRKLYVDNSFNIADYLVNGIVIIVSVLVLILITMFLFGKNIIQKKKLIN